jgi:hypothetical protein
VSCRPGTMSSARPRACMTATSEVPQCDQPLDLRVSSQSSRPSFETQPGWPRPKAGFWLGSTARSFAFWPSMGRARVRRLLSDRTWFAPVRARA